MMKEHSEHHDDSANVAAFRPMTCSLKEIRDAIPPHLFVRDTKRGLLYLSRDLTMAVAMMVLGSRIETLTAINSALAIRTPYSVVLLVRWSLWCLYWWFQGLIFTGLWVIGHECGHGAFSPSKAVCDSIGFVLHSLLWTPYFSWSISHHRHHSNHAFMENDEVYVPKTRSDLGIPNAPQHEIDWEKYFGDTPIFTLFMLIRQQLLAFPAYLIYNVSGQKDYPRWTNHFNPNSVIFSQKHARVVWLSNMGLCYTGFLLHLLSSRYGASMVIKLYGVPWLMVTHWFVMITYLHHTDPILPHYRGKAWNFQRGAAATVDRNFLGWQGRFFLHDVAHYHVIHHFFPKMPFYNGPEATKYLKAFIGDQYVYSDKPVFQALWESYNKCQFVEDEGDVLFYKDKRGNTVRQAGSVPS